MSELTLDTNALTYKPSEENFKVSFQNCYKLSYFKFYYLNLFQICHLLLIHSYRRPWQRSLGSLRRQ